MGWGEPGPPEAMQAPSWVEGICQPPPALGLPGTSAHFPTPGAGEEALLLGHRRGVPDRAPATGPGKPRLAGGKRRGSFCRRIWPWKRREGQPGREARAPRGSRFRPVAGSPGIPSGPAETSGAASRCWVVASPLIVGPGRLPLSQALGTPQERPMEPSADLTTSELEAAEFLLPLWGNCTSWPNYCGCCFCCVSNRQKTT